MRNIKKRRIIILILAAAAILLATGAYIAVPSGVTDIEIVTSDGDRVEESYDVYIGETVQLRCRISPQSFAHRDVDYYVSDEEILSVDKSGMLSGIKEGQTTLIIECAGVRKSVSIDVEPSVKEIRGLETEITLYVDDEYQFEPKVIMADESLETPSVSYKSNRKTVAVVDNKGLLTATGEGTTKITIKVGTLSETVKVIVEERPVVVTQSNNKDVSDSKKSVSKKSEKSSKKKKNSKRESNSGNTTKSDSKSDGNSVKDDGSGTDDNTELDSDTGDSGRNSNTVDTPGSGSESSSGSSNTDSNNTSDSGSSNTGSTKADDSGNSSDSSSSDSGASDTSDSNSGNTTSSNTTSSNESDPNSQTDANLIGE